MKANELQIGDFVLYNDDICIVDEIRVDNTVVLTALNTDVTSIDGDQVSVNEITPIPLTAEILEKNRFIYSILHNDWTNADCNFYLYVGGNGYWIQNTDIKLDYVHQLQHALRLCNIEKEIIV